MTIQSTHGKHLLQKLSMAGHHRFETDLFMSTVMSPHLLGKIVNEYNHQQKNETEKCVMIGHQSHCPRVQNVFFFFFFFTVDFGEVETTLACGMQGKIILI